MTASRPCHNAGAGGGPAIAAAGTASLVEGYLDVIAAHKAGITNAVTQAHIDTASAHQLHIALDGDNAGRAAARTTMRLARDSGLPTRTVRLPQGEDPASLDPDELHRLWQSAEPQPWSNITAQLNDTAPADSPQAAARAARAILDETAATGPLTRLVATHQTATACGVPFHLLHADTLHHRPAPNRAIVDTDTEVAARTYGLTTADTAHQIDDIATTIKTLNGPQPDPTTRGREPARSL